MNHSIIQAGMSFKLLLLKAWKPVTFTVFSMYSVYGYKQWNQAKEALKIKDTMTEKDLSDLFDKIDTDKSGLIDEKELKEALHTAGVDLIHFRLESMITVADENDDGKISKEEFAHLIKRMGNVEHAHPAAHPAHPTPPTINVPKPKFP